MNRESNFINKQQSASWFGILSVVLLKIEVFWDVTLFRLVNTQLLIEVSQSLQADLSRYNPKDEGKLLKNNRFLQSTINSIQENFQLYIESKHIQGHLMFIGPCLILIAE